MQEATILFCTINNRNRLQKVCKRFENAAECQPELGEGTRTTAMFRHAQQDGCFLTASIEAVPSPCKWPRQ